MTHRYREETAALFTKKPAMAVSTVWRTGSAYALWRMADFICHPIRTCHKATDSRAYEQGGVIPP